MGLERCGAWSDQQPDDRRTAGDEDAIMRDPWHEVQKNGGAADFWYLDDGDIMCHPKHVLSIFNTFDE